MVNDLTPAFRGLMKSAVASPEIDYSAGQVFGAVGGRGGP